jgi:ATP-binding cassette subfamily C protein
MLKSSSSGAADLVHQGRKAFVSGLAYAGLLSALINVLQLTVPLFMLQVHDRVVNSQSTDTLTMLIVVALIALVIYCILDYVRSLTFQVMASQLVRKLNLPILEAAVSTSIGKGVVQSGQAIRDLNDIRSFVTGNAISMPLEAAWSPIFLAVLFALHPLYGLVAAVSATIIIVLSLVSDLLTRRATRGDD